MDKNEIINRLRRKLNLDAHIANSLSLISRIQEMNDAVNVLKKIAVSRPSVIKTEEHPEFVSDRMEAELRRIAVNLEILLRKEKDSLDSSRILQKVLEKEKNNMTFTSSQLDGIYNRLKEEINKYQQKGKTIPQQIVTQFEEAIGIFNEFANKLVAISKQHNIADDRKIVKRFNSIKDKLNELQSIIEMMKASEISEKINDLIAATNKFDEAVKNFKKSGKTAEEAKVKETLEETSKCFGDVLKEKEILFEEMKQAINLYLKFLNLCERFNDELLSKIYS